MRFDLFPINGETYWLDDSVTESRDLYALFYWTTELRQVMLQEDRNMILRYRDLYDQLLQMCQQHAQPGNDDLDEVNFIMDCVNYTIARLRL